MSKTISTVGNSIVDKIGLVIESINTIFSTLVQETSDIGLVFTIIGFIFLCVTGVLIFKGIYTYGCGPKKQQKECLPPLIVIGIIFFVIGTITTMIALNNWIAPTREVVREIAKRLL